MRVPVTLEEAAAFCGQGGFVRLGLFEHSDEELAQVRDTFGLHELAVEHVQNFHIRPKIELYDQDGARWSSAHCQLRRRRRGSRVRRTQHLPRARLRDHRAAGRGERAARG
jgi:hypothetical protein